MTIFATLWRQQQELKRDSNPSDMNSLTVIMPANQVKPIAPRLNIKRKDNNNQADSTTTTTTAMAKPNNKRKITFHPSLGYAIPPPIPPKVARRNARERNRVKQVNSGFDVLRSHIPTAAKHKKMSKVDTLRHAVDYIRNLRKMLKEQDIANGIKTEVDDDDDDDFFDNDFEFDDDNSQQSFNDSNVSSPTDQTTTTTTLSNQPLYMPSHHYPLTPRTPESTTPEFSTAPTLIPGNTSLGYEANNYYTHSPNLMSPDSGHFSLHNHHQHLHQQQQQQQHPLLLAPSFHPELNSPVNSVDSSPSVYSDTPSFFAPAPLSSVVSNAQNFYYTDCMEQNSEEDELLDAIVKWQED